MFSCELCVHTFACKKSSKYVQLRTVRSSTFQILNRYNYNQSRFVCVNQIRINSISIGIRIGAVINFRITTTKSNFAIYAKYNLTNYHNDYISSVFSIISYILFLYLVIIVAQCHTHCYCYLPTKSS